VPGGEESKLVDLRFAVFSSSLDWSPDGTQIAFSDAYPGIDRLAIYLFDVRTGEERKITSPPSEIWGDWDPKFSPDGRMLAFKRVRAFLLDTIYLLPMTGGPPRLIRDDSKAIWGHAWTADGKSLIFSTQLDGSIFGLWRVPLNSRREPIRIGEGGLDAVTPVSSRKGNRIAWVNHLWDTSIYRIPFAGHSTPTLLIGSTLHVQGCSYSGDGRIAFVSDRSGSWEIWTAWADGSHQVRVTNFGGPATDSPRWSPDGRHLAIATRTLGGNKVFILNCESKAGTTRCGQPRQFVAGAGTEKWSDAQPAWSADGAYVYYTSNRSGRDEVWKQPYAGGPAVQMTHQGGFQPLESPDGKWLYFSKLQPQSIWRMPGSRPQPMDTHAAERLVIGPPHDVVPTGWIVTSDEVLFADLAGNNRSATIRGYRLGTGKTRDIVTLPEIESPSEVTSLSVSRDSRWLLYWQLDKAGSNIMVAEPAIKSPQKKFRQQVIVFYPLLCL
jgi:Tol biopolymer transport system component